MLGLFKIGNLDFVASSSLLPVSAEFEDVLVMVTAAVLGLVVSAAEFVMFIAKTIKY